MLVRRMGLYLIRFANPSPRSHTFKVVVVESTLQHVFLVAVVNGPRDDHTVYLQPWLQSLHYSSNHPVIRKMTDSLTSTTSTSKKNFRPLELPGASLPGAPWPKPGELQ